MIDGAVVDYTSHSGHGKLPIAMIRQKSDVVPTSSHDAILPNIVFAKDNQTGAPTIYIVSLDNRHALSAGSTSISEQLHEIKDKFGLNLSQLSKVLNVSRPQLYKWIEGESVPQRGEFNQKITEIYSLLDEIPIEHSKYFGKLANRYTPDGTTVMDVLTDSGLDKNKLLALYESIKSDIEKIESRKGNEMDKRHKYGASEVILPPNDNST